MEEESSSTLLFIAGLCSDIKGLTYRAVYSWPTIEDPIRKAVQHALCNACCTCLSLFIPVASHVTHALHVACLMVVGEWEAWLL